MPPQQTSAASETPLRVTVVHGDVRFVDAPLLVGHYAATRLTGTEALLDHLIGGGLTASLNAGLYPSQPGAHQIFTNIATSSNPLRIPRTEAVIVAGLGLEGSLPGHALVDSVRSSVMAWSQRVAEKQPPVATFQIAATLLGSGGSGISPGRSAQLIAKGALEANERVSNPAGQRSWPTATHLYLIELFHDRCVEAIRELQMLASAYPGKYLVEDVVVNGVGGLAASLSQGYRSAGYDFIRAVIDNAGVISYTVDTSRARREMRAQVAQLPLLRNLIEHAAGGRSDVQIGRTLFQLLVPVELEPLFAESAEVRIELDPGTAAIPWELLDTNDGERIQRLPWAIRSKLLRQFRARYIAETADATNDEPSILIVGEPAVDPSYAPLPGARLEAAAVANCFGSSELPATVSVSLVSPDSSPGPDAHAVINALLSRDWRMVHLTGHGAFPQYDRPDGHSSWNAGGIVLSNGAALGPREIASMRQLPELVFVNCCHQPLNPDALLLKRVESNWPLFASQMADALLTSGVRCVVVAGWAVDGEAASAFASRFYRELLVGRRFIDAVTAARREAFELGGNTWAAYQCYGDPDWGVRRGMREARRPSASASTQFDDVVSAQQLKLALEMIVVRCELQHFEGPTERAKIEYLEQRFSTRWGHEGVVAEAFGAAWAAAGDVGRAVLWFGRALSCADGRASLRASERFGDLRVRVASASLRDSGTSRPAARRQPAKIGESLASARNEIAEGIRLLEHVNSLASTTGRTSVLASAYKQLAMVEYIAGRKAEETSALGTMQKYYTQASSQARQTPDHEWPSIAATLNVLSATLLSWEGGAELRAIDAESVARVRKGLALLNASSPDFWSLIAEIELRLYEALSEHALRMYLGVIDERLKNLFARVTTPGLWESVLNRHELMLRKYADRATAGEHVAALMLIEALGRFAGFRKDVPASDVVIANGPADIDAAERIAKALEGAGLMVAMSTASEEFEIVARREEALEVSKACVVLLSRATNTPDQALVSYWGSVLRRRWREPRYPIFLARRHKDATPPGFLPDAPLHALGDTSEGLAKLIAEVVKAVRPVVRRTAKRKPRTARSTRKR